MQDKFEDLRTFVAVVQCRGFAAAALRLGVAKSAVSRRVQELEQRLGAHLINRSTRTLSVTDAGQAFFERASTLLHDLEEAEGLAATGATEPVGTLRILGPSALGQMQLVPLICSFLEEHSRVSVDISLNDNFVDLVAEGFDMAVRIGELRDSSLSARRLGTVRRVACASPAYLRRHGVPTEPRHLARHWGVVYSAVEDRRFWSFVDPRTGKEESVEVRSRFHANTADAMCAAAVAGHGITVLPTFAIHKAVLAGDLVPILLPYEKASIGVHAVYPSRHQIPTKVRAFVDYLAASWEPLPQWDRDVLAAHADGVGSG